MAYGKDVRRLVYELVEGGGSKVEAARRFGLSRRTVYNWLTQPLPTEVGRLDDD